MTTLLIDGDLLVYKAASATEFDVGVEVEGSPEEDLFVRVASLTHALDAAHTVLARYRKNLNATAVLICFSGQDNFRKKLYPAYKANRTGPKPVVFAALKQRLAQDYKTYEKHGIEADDCLGILATHPKLIPGDKIIVSADKDMMQIPCKVSPDGREVVVPKNPARWHLLQTLIGDPTDNYPGCKGVGKVKADKLLPPDEPSSWWPNIVQAFEAIGQTEADALVQARVAKIITHEWYDFEKKEPKLWTP